MFFFMDSRNSTTVLSMNHPSCITHFSRQTDRTFLSGEQPHLCTACNSAGAHWFSNHLQHSCTGKTQSNMLNVVFHGLLSPVLLTR